MPKNGSHLTDLPIPHQAAKVVLDRAQLFHGSKALGITEIERATQDTLGAGVYLTDEDSACAYARRRARWTTGTPVLYEVEIAHARLADLTDVPTLGEIMTGFRAVLAQHHQRESDTGGSLIWIEALRRLIAEIDTGVRVGHVKVVTRQCGKYFSAYLQDCGFDGVFAWEGGEGDEGDVDPHRTYVLFDPAAVRIVSARNLTQLGSPAAKSAE